MKCESCNRIIKPNREAAMLPDAPGMPLICTRCLLTPTNNLHHELYPRCAVHFHDLWDHRAAVGVLSALLKIRGRQIMNGPELMQMKFVGGTARDVLEAGLCSPQCLLALADDGTCTCICDGEFHSVLVDSILNHATED